MYYYILESGLCVQSKWNKEIGEKHLNSKIGSITNQNVFDSITAELEKRYRSQQTKNRQNANREADLWLAGTIIKAGHSLNIDNSLIINVMKTCAPNSYNAIRKLK
jgi:hypothetical protein